MSNSTKITFLVLVIAGISGFALYTHFSENGNGPSEDTTIQNGYEGTVNSPGTPNGDDESSDTDSGDETPVFGSPGPESETNETENESGTDEEGGLFDRPADEEEEFASELAENVESPDDTATVTHPEGQSDESGSEDEAIEFESDPPGPDVNPDAEETAESGEESTQQESSDQASSESREQDQSEETESEQQQQENAWPREYTVQTRNETLWDIAKNFYGAGYEWERIRDANEDLQGENPIIREGMTITIPAPPGRESSDPEDSDSGEEESESRDVPFEAPDGTRWYRVQKGETLWDIARDRLGSGTRHEELEELNDDHLENPDMIREGDWILIPAEEN